MLLYRGKRGCVPTKPLSSKAIGLLPRSWPFHFRGGDLEHLPCLLNPCWAACAQSSCQPGSVHWVCISQPKLLSRDEKTGSWNVHPGRGRAESEPRLSCAEVTVPSPRPAHGVQQKLNSFTHTGAAHAFWDGLCQA